MREQYRTLASEIRHEPARIKGSRFIARGAPATSVEQAEAFLQRIRAEFHDARHHCFAWRLGPEGEPYRFSDDGEPSNSGGRPILQQMESSDLSDAVVVVTRYYGGIKLGVGGLIRAYGGATASALERAPLRTVRITSRVRVEYPYECSGAIQALLAETGLQPVGSEFGEAVVMELEVPPSQEDALRRALLDRTAGRARVS